MVIERESECTQQAQVNMPLTALNRVIPCNFPRHPEKVMETPGRQQFPRQARKGLQASRFHPFHFTLGLCQREVAFFWPSHGGKKGIQQWEMGL